MPVDLQSLHHLYVTQLWWAALVRHLQEVSAAAARPGASKLAHCSPHGAEEYAPTLAAYRGPVRQRAQQTVLPQRRTGSHWLAEEME